MSLYIPKHYVNKLSLIETQLAIKLVKDTFERKLAKNLNLTRVSAPLFVEPKTGLNDNLSGIEIPVGFNLTKLDKRVEIVQSLAKWKRMVLGQYGFSSGMGLYTDMNAIRPDEETDNLHSIYVDQWDWEKVILKEDRKIDFLKNTVSLIIKSLYETNQVLKQEYPILDFEVQENVYFITSEELLQMFPDLSPKERENEICRLKKTVFIIGIGDKLSDDTIHDMRAPDYDDWSMNGDILVWCPILEVAVELSSMGIRVDSKAITEQLKKSEKEGRLNFPFHKDVVSNKLPLSIGGGIGQSRVCQVLLEKLHIGEVQVSTWKEEDLQTLKEIGAIIL
jgi:aspartate--ammonia ligase